MFKRILKYLGILFAGLVLAFVIMGLFVTEVEYTVTMPVDAPVEATWATFMDADRVGEWLTGFTHVEHLEGEPDAVGSTHRMHFTDGVYMDETVTDIVPPKLYGFDMETDMFTGHVAVALTPEEGATVIEQTVSMRGSSFLMRAMLPVLKPYMASQAAAVLDSLRLLVETNPTAVRVEEPESAPPIEDGAAAPGN